MLIWRHHVHRPAGCVQAFLVFVRCTRLTVRSDTVPVAIVLLSQQEGWVSTYQLRLLLSKLIWINID